MIRSDLELTGEKPQRVCRKPSWEVIPENEMQGVSDLVQGGSSRDEEKRMDFKNI